MNNPSLAESMTTVIVSFLVFIMIFLILREFWGWYWKINERNKLLKSIDSKLSQLLAKWPENQNPVPVENKLPSNPESPASEGSYKPWNCPNCETANSVSLSECRKCGTKREILERGTQ